MRIFTWGEQCLRAGKRAWESEFDRLFPSYSFLDDDFPNDLVAHEGTTDELEEEARRLWAEAKVAGAGRDVYLRRQAEALASELGIEFEEEEEEEPVRT